MSTSSIAKRHSMDTPPIHCITRRRGTLGGICKYYLLLVVMCYKARRVPGITTSQNGGISVVVLWIFCSDNICLAQQ